MLEINAAGSLHEHLARFPRLTHTTYPAVDMLRLPFGDDSFDLVVHSDTLEHVEDPVGGLSECLRVTKPRGTVCFTIPVIPSRLTRSRKGLSHSFHGPHLKEHLVHTEFGADFWALALAAGAAECRVINFDHPAAVAVVLKKCGGAGG